MKLLLASTFLLVCLSQFVQGEDQSNSKDKANILKPVDGLEIEIVEKPEKCDRESKAGDVLHMHYTGTLTDGSKFDSR